MTSTERHPWRDAALSLSFANLCLVGTWNSIFRMISSRLREVDDAWLAEAMTRPANHAARAAFGALLVNMLVLFLIFFAALKLIRRTGSPALLTAARCLFLFLFMSPADFLGWKLAQGGMTQLPFELLRAIWTILLLIPVLAMVQMLVYKRDLIYRGIRTVTLILLPVLPLNLVRVGWALKEISASHANKLPERAGKLPAAPPGRVIWVIFDEMDYRLAFEKRPSSVPMPNFDRLRKEALFATGATPPAYSTAPSMASVMTGRLVHSSDATVSDPLLMFSDGSVSTLRRQQTIFQQARQDGYNTAVVGYFLPYCAILGSALSECAQPSSDDLWSRDFWAQMTDQWNREFHRNWLLVRVDSKARYRVPWFGWGTRTEQRNAYLFIRKHARAAAMDRDLGLTLLHWPIPHLLGIYNRHTGQLTYDQPSNYLDNLALTDRTLGELRSWLEEAKLWDQTTLVITADHPLRAKSWMSMSSWTKEEADLTGNKCYPHVPFIVKTARNSHGLEYAGSFNTILANHLLLALMKGKLDGVDDVAAWLNRHKNDAPIILPE